MIDEWMKEFFLKLNSSKTKILIIKPPSLSAGIRIRGTFLNDKCVRFVQSAKNLGVVLDDELSFQDQIIKVVKSCFSALRNLSRIKQFLTYEQLHTAIYSYVFSKLDYCNSLYYGINTYLLSKMQSVQNSAARLLKKKGGFGDVSKNDYIRKSHWLQVRERIIFKICLLVHKSLIGDAPRQELLSYSTSGRTMNLVQPSFKTSVGRRCFPRMGPKMWNLLPTHIRTEHVTVKFKSALKTFLFVESERYVQKLDEI